MGVGVGVGVAVAVAVGVGVLPLSTLQVVPLSRNVVGTALVPDRDARNPALALAPVPSAPL